MNSTIFKISTYVYRQVIKKRGWKCHVWRFIRRVLIKIFDDPLCQYKNFEYSLVGPLSHELAFYQKVLRHYDRLPSRISDFYLSGKSQFSAIDVGANIGDSIASMYRSGKTKILAVEPNDKFNYYLDLNWGNNDGVVICTHLCSSKDATVEVSLNTKGSTASFESNQLGDSVIAKSLSTIFAENRIVETINFIKVDTDGFDFEVLKGAESLIEGFQPSVLIECDIFHNANYIQDC